MLTATVDMGEFRKIRQGVSERIGLAIAAAVSEAADAGVEAAQQAAPISKGGPGLPAPGRLRREIHADRIQKTGDEVFTYVVSPTSYARFVEYPTRPHQIWPKEGHGLVGPLRSGQSRRSIEDVGTHRVALRWYVGGKPVFAQFVNHPGTSGKFYMRKAGNVAQMILRLALTEKLGRYLAQYSN